MLFLLLFLLAAGLNIILGIAGWPAVFSGHLQDPDSYMRLLRLEEGVRAGHLLTTVAGDQSGAGVMVEWSRLLDMILWLLAAPLAPFIGWHKAIFCAGVAIGPLGVGALGAALAWAVEPIALRRHLWSAAVAAALLPGFMTISLPGLVHYHIALLALTVLTAGFALRAGRSRSGAGFMAGVAGGLAIWMTPETMPFVLASCVPLLLLLNSGNGAVIAAAAAGLFDMLAVALLLDQPQAGAWAPEVDRLSLVYIVMGLMLLCASMLLWRLSTAQGRWRAAAGWALMAAALAGWVAMFPGVAEGPYGLLPPAQAQAFFSVISEQMPVTGWGIPLFLTPGILAVAYALWRAVDVKPRPATQFLAPPADFLKSPLAPRARLLWLYAAFIATVALALGAKFTLFVGFSACFGAALLPVALSEADMRWAESAPFTALSVRILMMVLMLLTPEAISMAAPVAKPAPGAKTYPSCTLDGAASLLAPAAHQVVEAPPEDTPELLYRTQAETVGSLFHHGIDGYMRDRAIWRAAPGSAVPPEIAAAKAQWVLFCPTPGRYLLVADLPPNTTLWDALEAGQPPSWLVPAGSNAQGWVLYRVK